MLPTNEEALFALALTKPADERAAWLERECAGDPALRARLDALLAAHEQPDALLTTRDEADQPTLKLEPADMPDDAVGMTLGRYPDFRNWTRKSTILMALARCRPCRCWGRARKVRVV